MGLTIRPDWKKLYEQLRKSSCGSIIMTLTRVRDDRKRMCAKWTLKYTHGVSRERSKRAVWSIVKLEGRSCLGCDSLQSR